MLDLIQHWMARRQVKELKSWVALDLETSGWLNAKGSVIAQVGWLSVFDQKFEEDDVCAIYVKRPWDTMQYGATKVNGITDELLQREGRDPREVLLATADLLRSFISIPAPIITHNGWKCDMPFLNREWQEHGIPFQLGPDDIIDTGMIVKSRYMAPWDADGRVDVALTGQELAHEIWRYRSKKGEIWSLDDYCVPTYGLDVKYGIDRDAMHDAGQDALACHWLLVELMAALEKERRDRCRTE